LENLNFALFPLFFGMTPELENFLAHGRLMSKFKQIYFLKIRDKNPGLATMGRLSCVSGTSVRRHHCLWLVVVIVLRET
jgi:hypothetical protein